MALSDLRSSYFLLILYHSAHCINTVLVNCGYFALNSSLDLVEGYIIVIIEVIGKSNFIVISGSLKVWLLGRSAHII